MRSLIWFMLLYAVIGFSQPNRSNLYHFTIERIDTALVIHSPLFLSAFNQNGYNNQPSFFGDHVILISSQFPDSGATDIYMLNLLSYNKKRITATSEGEYSPIPMSDGQHFSTVRVETEPEPAQRLWKMGLDKRSEIRPLFPKMKDVGYHCWLTDSLVALFQVGDPNTLSVADLRDQKNLVFASNVGRCLQRSRSGNLLYVHKLDTVRWYLKEFDPETQRAEVLVETLPGSEDFCVMEDGTMLMINDDILYSLENGSRKWNEVIDLRLYGIKSANRLAVRKNRLIVVAY